MIFKTLLSLIFLNISLFACASGFNYYDKQFVFLEKRQLPFSNFSGDLKDSATYNMIYSDYKKRNKEANLQEWMRYLPKLNKEQIEQIVYKKQNLNLIKNKEVLNYLNFVHEQEKYVSFYYSYGKKIKKVNPSILISQALENLQKVKTPYLKLRYFYLALRLAHFKNKNPLRIYEKFKYLIKNNPNSIVNDWIQGIYAGALIKNNERALGVYEFIKLFHEDKINWHLSFYNFKYINTNEHWQELLFLAKNKEEKIKFHVLRSLNKNANIIEELENISKIDKNSPWIDYILYRQLLHSQHFFDQSDLYVRDFKINETIEYLKTVKKDNMYLVNLSLAYFNFYKNDLKTAQRYIDTLLKTHPKYEVKTLNFLIYLNKIKQISKESENSIYTKMKKLVDNNPCNNYYIQNYTFLKLDKLYKKQNMSLKRILSTSTGHLNIDIFTLKSMEDFIKFINKKDLNKLEKYFLKNLEQNNYIKKSKNKYILNEKLKMTYTKVLINNLKFQEALNINADILKQKIVYNPFNANFKGNNRQGKKETYTIKQFLEKIILIKKKIKENKNSIIDNYLFANALFNLSYFGNSNTLASVYRSTYSFHSIKLEKHKLQTSIEHYKKAIENSTNKEFKAKLTYMLAKNELALFDLKYSKKTYGYEDAIKINYESKRLWTYSKNKIFKEYIKNGYGEFFHIIKDKYSNTNYYKELIKECANLRVYEKAKL